MRVNKKLTTPSERAKKIIGMGSQQSFEQKSFEQQIINFEPKIARKVL